MKELAGWAMAAGGGAGLLAGSLLGTVAVRWPAGRSIARGRSSCDGCGRPIPPWRLVPLASFVMQRGQAACCGTAIDPHHPAMEAACALIGVAALAISPDAAGAAGALFGWILLTLAVLDARHLWLPDRLVVPLGLVGLIGGLAGLAPPVGERMAGGVAGWVALATIAWAYQRARGREGLGKGDAKLLGAIGLWLGWRPLPWVVLGASLIGLAWVALLRMGGRSVARHDPLPLGTLLAVAAWGAWLMEVMVGH